ncbi:hypothetical protein GCM10008908_25290 [Clostridium subterminale]|uniref:Uncharacterized protein n=1 Tax=Clostridium subterminale TaxID=1550 RepID=A0ABN1KST7_CLOSU
MDLLGVFSYACLAFLIFNLLHVILMKYRGKAINSFTIIVNSLFLVLISTLSIWQNGIYVDEYSLSGSSVDFYINLVNIAIFIIIAAIASSNKNEHKNH